MKALRVLLVVAAAWPAASAGAQPPTEPPVNTISLRPAPEPVPALKYRLVPERRTLLPGNAAIFYHRAIQLVIETRMRARAEAKEAAEAPTRSVDLRIANWATGPIAKLPREDVAQELERFRSALHEVDLGAARSSCDWGLDQRADAISLRLPEIQEMRPLGRLVVLRARLAIVDGKTDEAMHWIENGLAMGRHVGQGPTIIQALVGTAIGTQMSRCLEDLIQAPGTPSLYWALADRPRPLVDMRAPFEGERTILERELPELARLDGPPWSLDEARQFSDTLQRKLYTLASGEPIPGSNLAVPPDLSTTARQLGIAAMAAKIYPEAKRALIAQGRSAEEVDAMPVVQASTLYTYQEYQRLRDESYKWVNVPYWQSSNHVDRAWVRTVEQKLANPMLTFFSILAPALNAARVAVLRTERHLDTLQCIEAIRLYAAAHDGKLPERLEEIGDAPVPLDPAAGQPFTYAAHGDWATLSAPIPRGAPEHPSYRIQYVLKVVR